ncbi:MAG: hypothetical protein ACK4GN_04090 [Runella sp.]
MNLEERKKLIQAARTGHLTEDEYTVYDQLMRQHPEWLDEQAEEEALGEAIAEAADAELYAAARQLSMPQRQRKQRPVYQMAAAVAALLMLSGVGYWWLTRPATPPVLMAVQKLDFYNGDSTSQNSRGFAEGDFAIGDITLAWYAATRQTEDIRYIFCNDTLALYLRDTTLRAQLQPRLRLNYRPSLQHYELKGMDSQKNYPLEPCTLTPQPLVP